MPQHIILGLHEEITIFGAKGKKEKVLARIDTGATSSSMDHTLAARLELTPLTKTKLIKSALGVKRRPTILAKIKIRHELLETEFTLADRQNLRYPLLIGQNILKIGNYLIDPHKSDSPL